MARRCETALRAFGDECEAFAAELNEEGETPSGPDDGEERGRFYWDEQDGAWHHQGDDDWDEFLGSVGWDEETGRWAADWQEHA